VLLFPASHFYLPPAMLATVSTQLSYFTLPADGSKPWVNINADPVTGRHDKNWESAKHLVEIEDLRGKLSAVSLDTNGFQFFLHPAKYTSFTNDEEVRREYYPESIDFLKQTTGASRVVIFDHSKYTPSLPLGPYLSHITG
jgi:hypothetical protein